MVDVTAAVRQKVRFVLAKALYKCAVRTSWVAVGPVVAENQSLIDLLQPTRFASAHQCV